MSAQVNNNAKKTAFIVDEDYMGTTMREESK